MTKMTFAEFTALVLQCSLEDAEAFLLRISENCREGGLIHARLVGIEITDAALWVGESDTRN
jgi:hypothetical protein